MTEETNPLDEATDVVAEEVTVTGVNEAVGSEAEGEGAPDGPTLSIVDVRNAVNIIDYACGQGSFKGWETITQVMQVRNNLNNFVMAVSPPVEEGEGEGEATVDSEGGTDEAPATPVAEAPAA